jgi:uncharacterized membrane protein YdjX (TVP38/TMEM64 family)
MKKIIIKILIIAGLLTCIAVGAYFLIKAVDIKTLKETLGDTVIFWIVVGLLQIFQVIFIPVSNQLITVPMALLFKDDLLKVWITSWVSIWIATLILYFIGRWGGEKLLKWVLSDEDKVNKCKNFLKKGWIYYPIGMLLPLPDDIITVLAGTAKLNILFVIVCSLFTRGIDTGCSVFGFGFLTRYWWGWLILIGGILLLILVTILFKKRNGKIKNT